MYWSAKLKRLAGLECNPILPKEYKRPEADGKIKAILSKNRTIQGDDAIIGKLMRSGEVVYFRQGERLIQEGAQDNDVFYLLSGDVDIVFGSQRATIREAPNQVGEMAAIDLGKPRSANVVARTKEVAALKVPGIEFNAIWSSSPYFQQLMQLEMTARHRERVLASHVAKENNSLVWFITSLAAATVTMLISWFLATPGEWTIPARAAATGGVGVLVFIGMLLHNPAFFWRRCFGIVLISMIGTLALDQFVAVEATQGFGSLSLKINPGNGEAGSAMQIAELISFLAVLVLCALMEYATRKD